MLYKFNSNSHFSKLIGYLDTSLNQCPRGYFESVCVCVCVCVCEGGGGGGRGVTQSGAGLKASFPQ